VINFEVAHDTGSQIDTGLLQAFNKDDTVIGKVVEALEQSQKWPSCSLPTYYFSATLFLAPFITFVVIHINMLIFQPFKRYSLYHALKFVLCQKQSYIIISWFAIFFSLDKKGEK
jgi:hypothetical protein